MVKLYHASRVLFEKPNIQALSGDRAHGRGFYFTPDITTVYTYLPNYKREIPNDDGVPFYDGPRGVIYESNVDQSFIEDHMQNLDGHIDEDDIARFRKIADDPTQSDIRHEDVDRLQVGRPRTDLIKMLDMTSDETCKVLAERGILGTYKSDLVCFFREKDIPNFKISRVAGNFPKAHDALKRQEETGVLSVDQPVREDGTFAGRRKNYSASALGVAANQVHRTKDRALISAFEDMVDPLLTSETFTGSHTMGFSLRESLGHAVQRTADDAELGIDHEESGHSTFNRTFESARFNVGKTPEVEDLIAKAEKFRELLQKHQQQRRNDSV